MELGSLQRYIDDRPHDGVFRVHPDVFVDPELFELEHRYIFERTWVFLGLASQVRAANDYLATWIGRLPVLVMRSGAGTLGAFLNVCRHKGAMVCRLEQGNKKFHTCPYHGWAYDTAGKIVDVKDRKAGGYSAAFEADDHNLIPLARFENYKGLLFGSLSADVPPLADFLGDLRFFLDCAMEQGPQGMEFVPGRIAFTYDGNWKTQLDNGSDAYHLTSTHTSFMEVQRRRADAASGNQAARQFDWQKRFSQETGAYTFPHGHNVIWMNQAEVSKRPVYARIDEVRSRVGDTLADWMLKARNLTVFPSVQIADSTSLNIRTFRPLAVDRTEVRYYCLAPIGEDPQVRAWRLRQFEDFFNVSGFATPDDTTCYEDIQLGLQARQVGWIQGYSRGMTVAHAGPNAIARSLGIDPATSTQGMYDLQTESWGPGVYREWARLMEAGASGRPAYASTSTKATAR